MNSAEAPVAGTDDIEVDESLRRLRGQIALEGIMNDDVSNSDDDHSHEIGSDIDDEVAVKRSVSPYNDADADSLSFVQSAKFLEHGLIFTASLSLGRQQGVPEALKQPWEKGIFSHVFGEPPQMPWLKNRSLSNNFRTLSPILSSSLPSVEPKPVQLPGFSTAVLRIKRPALKVARPSAEVMRSRAIAKWRCIVESDLYATRLGKQLVEFILDGNSETMIHQILEDTFSSKATETLLKRGQSIFNYMTFCQKSFGALSLLYDESYIYKYLDSLRAASAAPSCGKSFLEAMNFALHLLSPGGVEQGWMSARVKGIASKMHQAKSPLDQAPALYVWEVKLLHNILCNAEVLQDKVVTGYMIFLIYACARWSDGQFPETIINDTSEGYGYFEMQTRNHKTAQGARKAILMPLVATSPGLGPVSSAGLGWVDEWLLARKKCGLEFCPNSPTLPAMRVDGTWSDSPMSASEGSLYLRELIHGYAPSKPRRVKQLRSHSLKSTMLSYCAKRPLPKEYRRALGHHIDSSDVSVATYSRDYLYAPLLALDQLLCDINDGTFNPDESRAQRAACVKKLKRGELPERGGKPEDVARVEAAEEESEHSDESESECSEASIPDADIDDHLMSETRKGKDVSLFPSSEKEHTFFWDSGKPLVTFQHNSSGVLHCRRPDSPSKLGCSRTISKAFTKIDTGLNFSWPRCVACARLYGVKLAPSAKVAP